MPEIAVIRLMSSTELGSQVKRGKVALGMKGGNGMAVETASGIWDLPRCRLVVLVWLWGCWGGGVS